MSDSQVTLHALGALAVLFVSLLFACVRIWRGPSFADRVLGLDLLGTIVISVVLVFCVFARQSAYVDVALALALVAFLGNAVYGRFIEREAEGKRRRG